MQAAPNVSANPVVFCVGCFGLGACLSGMITLWGGKISLIGSEQIERCVPLAFAMCSVLTLSALSTPRLAAVLASALLPLASAAVFSKIPTRPTRHGIASEAAGRSRFAPIAAVGAFLAVCWFAYTFLKSSVSHAMSGAVGSTVPFLLIGVLSVSYLFVTLRFVRQISFSYARAVSVPLMCLAFAVLSLGEQGVYAARLVSSFAFSLLYMYIWLVLTKVAHLTGMRGEALFACFTLSTNIGICIGWLASSFGVPLLQGAFDVGEDAWYPFIMTTIVVGMVATASPIDRLFVGQTSAFASLQDMIDLATKQKAAHAAEGWGLTTREEEVLALLLQGSSRADIRDALGISINTVNTHIRNIYEKTGLHSRKELINGVQQG